MDAVITFIFRSTPIFTYLDPGVIITAIVNRTRDPKQGLETLPINMYESYDGQPRPSLEKTEPVRLPIQ